MLARQLKFKAGAAGGSGDTSYDEFVKREGVPMIRSLWVEGGLNLPLAPWLRKGGRGAYIHRDASGIDTSYIAIDCYAVEIAPGGSLNPERYLYDEMLYVLKGNGAATIWTPDTTKQTFEWQEGSLFTNVSRKLGGTMIEYEDEDRAIRALYERECARHGVKVNMRPVETN